MANELAYVPDQMILDFLFTKVWHGYGIVQKLLTVGPRQNKTAEAKPIQHSTVSYLGRRWGSNDKGQYTIDNNTRTNAAHVSVGGVLS